MRKGFNVSRFKVSEPRRCEALKLSHDALLVFRKESNKRLIKPSI